MRIKRSSAFPRLAAIFLLTIGAVASARADTAAPQSVEQWGLFETRFAGPSDGNPFTDVSLAATFSSGNQHLTIHGFYDGNGEYGLRFMPPQQGNWHFETTSNRPELAAKTGDFLCTPPHPGHHGPVGVKNTYHFAYADGTPFIPFGTTCYAWVHQPDPLEDQTLQSLKASPFNKVRMMLLPGNSEVLSYPYARDAAGKWDPERFNPAFFQHLEKRIQQLGDEGIEAELILFNPYKKGDLAWFDKLDNAGDDRYLHYVVARLAPYRNVWWSLANEYGQIKGKTDDDWDHFFQVVQADDPYNHLRSIHNAAKFYDSHKPWVTHASIQNGSAVADFGRAVLYRELCPKPLMYDEICYEGDINVRWGRLSGQEMTKRFWLATIAGAYATHGETYSNTEKVSWTTEGGKLRGSSPPRLAFLRKILEAGPPEGIEPIDEYYETHIGGKAGQYYLVYFGEERPTEWTFLLPRDPPDKKALIEGTKFHVDILDTWNMTVTPVDRTFTTAKIAGNAFPAAEENARIPLPGKPYMALRIQRIP